MKWEDTQASKLPFASLAKSVVGNGNIIYLSERADKVPVYHSNGQLRREIAFHVLLIVQKRKGFTVVAYGNGLNQEDAPDFSLDDTDQPPRILRGHKLRVQFLREHVHYEPSLKALHQYVTCKQSENGARVGYPLTGCLGVQSWRKILAKVS